LTVEKTYKSIKKRRKAIKKLGDVVFQMKDPKEAQSTGFKTKKKMLQPSYTAAYQSC